jgi:hypothetical protein
LGYRTKLLFLDKFTLLSLSFPGSAYASKSGRNERLDFHVIQSFLVSNIFECVTHCLDYEQCVSMNFEKSENGHDESKKCELNSGVKSNFPDHIIMNDDFDYYNIINP